MPELPEVQTVLDTLKNQIKDDCIETVEVYYPKIIVGQADVFKKQLINQSFTKFHRLGKFLIFEMTDLFLIVHLRMEGKFFISNQLRLDAHTHCVFKLKSGRFLSYHDVRKFGRLQIVSDLSQCESLQRLGVEYFDCKLTKQYLFDRFQSKSIPIKTALLDQSIIAGIGNIYANEILFDANIHPLTPCCCLSLRQCQRIIDSTKKILELSIQLGGTTIRSYTSSLGVTGRFQQQLMVHQQKKCHVCHGEIIKIKVNTRGTYFCPNCQKKLLKVAITGSMGSGKSEVSRYLMKKGYECYSADQIVDDLYRFDQSLISELQSYTDEGIVDQNEINKRKFGQLLFTNSAFKEKAEALIHRRVYQTIDEFVKQTQQSIIFFEIPLLFETKKEHLFDEVIVVDISPENQQMRLMKYRKMDPETIQLRLNHQMPASTKVELADVVFDNNVTKKALKQQIDQYLERRKKC